MMFAKINKSNVLDELLNLVQHNNSNWQHKCQAIRHKDKDKGIKSTFCNFN